MVTRRAFLAAVGASAIIPAATSAQSACADVSPAAAPGQLAAPTPILEGYIQTWDASAVDIIRRDISALTHVGLPGPALINNGSALQENPTHLAEVAAFARSQSKRTELVFSNWEVGGDGFSQASLDGLLLNAGNQKKVATELVRRVQTLGLDGIQIDLEELKPRHASGLAQFARVLRAALPKGKDVSMAVGTYESKQDFADNGLIFQGLNSSIDRYVLMSYVERGEWTPYADAGPIGSLTYLRTSAAAARAAGIPTGKLVLGSSGMGFAWHPGGSGELTSYDDIVRLAGSRAQYRVDVGEWTATLADGTILWWSDQRSLAARVALAKELGLPGVAVWSLNTAAPLS